MNIWFEFKHSSLDLDQCLLYQMKYNIQFWLNQTKSSYFGFLPSNHIRIILAKWDLRLLMKFHTMFISILIQVCSYQFSAINLNFWRKYINFNMACVSSNHHQRFCLKPVSVSFFSCLLCALRSGSSMCQARILIN